MYLQPADYAAYGIADAADAQVAAASRLVDAELGRPQGLLWAPDSNGLPGWMAHASAARSFRIASAISPGTSVTLAVAGVSFGQGDVGAAVILDRSGGAEACIVTAASGNTLTLDSVRNPHAMNSGVEFGLAVSETLDVLYGTLIRPESRPIARVLGVTGSYLSGRNDRRGAWLDELLTIGTNGDAWSSFPLGQLDIADDACRLLPGTIRGGFSRVRMEYVAGWSYENLPAAIRQATANLVRGALDIGFSGNLKTLKAGNGTMERFSGSGVDADTRNLLMPYRNIRL